LVVASLLGKGRALERWRIAARRAADPNEGLGSQRTREYGNLQGDQLLVIVGINL
jgi:hypothetical protein